MIDGTARRAGALDRLEAFLPDAGVTYTANRNFDRGPGHPVTTSRLSGALQRRIVSEEEVLRAVLGRHPREACEKFAQEVVWRTYWKGWLEWHPSVWDDFVREVHTPTSPFDAETLEKALRGSTGLEPFDAWRRELQETGFLHNHVRMWFASIWSFTLKLPWQLGAQLFLRELVDADAAANTLSWRWVLGLQTLGKHYVARADNIAKFTAGRFDPQGLLNEAASPLPPPLPPSRRERLDTFTHDALPSGRLGLLVHAEDLSVEVTELGDFPFAKVAIFAPESAEGSTARGRFELAAMEDASERIESAYRCAPPALRTVDDFTAWSRSLDGVLTMMPFAGPVRGALWPWLRASPVPLWLARRTYDDFLFPHATRGFFPFRKRLPALLDEVATKKGPPTVRFMAFAPQGR